MRIISFSLRGKMAHFRKFYSNSSALSYFIPPRTTICGIVAGLLGYERDTYYNDFTIDKFKVAISSLKPIKKTMQKMNYLMINSVNDLNGSQEYHSQTPMELIIPESICDSFIDYKIWISHEDKLIMTKLEKLFSGKGEAYYKSVGSCMALGSAFNLGWIEIEGIFEGRQIDSATESHIFSSIPVGKVIELKTAKLPKEGYRILKEELPLEFDENRRITDRGLKDVLINITGNEIIAEVESFIEIENRQNIVWME